MNIDWVKKKECIIDLFTDINLLVFFEKPINEWGGVVSVLYFTISLHYTLFSLTFFLVDWQYFFFLFEMTDKKVELNDKRPY